MTARVVPWLVVLLPLNAWWVGQIECIRYWSSPTMLSLFYNVVFLVALVTGLNTLIARISPWAAKHVALNSRHLVIVYVALCISSSMASLDNFQLQVVGITHWKAHATPENQWATLFHDLVPRDLVLSDDVALKNIVEGGSSLYRRENYGPWLRPAAWWSSYAAALWLVTLCMSSLFRRRWLESERLQFPIIHVPTEMIAPKTRLWRQPAMWAVAAVVFALETSNALHSVKPAFPKFPFKVDEVPSLNLGNYLDPKMTEALGLLYLSFYPFAIGLAFLLPTELVFSTVLFWWVYKLQIAVTVAMGIPSGEGRAPFHDQQMFGGYLAIGFLSVWMARRHFRRVYCTALNRPGGYDDSDEPWPYRTQLLLLLGGLVYCLWFAIIKTRMAWWVAPLFYAVYFTLALAVMRIRAEMGIPAHDLLVKGPVQSIPRIVGTNTKVFGVELLPKQTLATFALHRFYNRGYRGHVAPHQIEAFKLAERMGMSTRGLFGLMWLLLPVGTLLTFWAATSALYSQGADAKAAPNNIFYGNEPWTELVARLQDPQPFSKARLIASATGFGGTLLMMAGHTRVNRWPVHPIGYALGNCWAVHWLWGPLTIGWVAKVLVLRYGGSQTYRRATAAAIGLVLGDMFAGGFWDLFGLFRRRMYLRIWS